MGYSRTASTCTLHVATNHVQSFNTIKLHFTGNWHSPQIRATSLIQAAVLMVCVCTSSTMTGNAVITLLFFTAFILACCNGDRFYVQSTENETSCPRTAAPANCRLISEYAANSSSFNGTDDGHVDMVFLPGLHTLHTQLFIWELANLVLRPLEPEHNTTITCDNAAAIYFDLQRIELVEIRSLEFRSCLTDNRDSNTSVVFFAEVREAIIENCTFINNYSPAIGSYRSNLTIIGSHFTYSSSVVPMSLDYSNVTFTDHVFANNSNHIGLSVVESFLTTTGVNIFDGNSGIYGGALYCISSVVAFTGNTTFTNNKGTLGGVLYATNLHVFLNGSVHFESNTGYERGGVFALSHSHFNISGDIPAFINNTAIYGGTYYLVSSAITFVEGDVTFSNNSAINGGALYLVGDSSLKFSANLPVTVRFVDNSADDRGGVIFIQDSSTLSYCVNPDDGNFFPFAIQECSFQVSADYYDYEQDTTLKLKMIFTNNYAVEAGGVIYGGALDSCFLRDSDSNAVSGAKVFDQIAEYGSNNKNRTSEISSDPFMVCICNGSEHNCARTSVSYTVYPGASLQVTVVALGQRNGAVPATVLASANGLTIDELEKAQRVSSMCSNLSYTIYAKPGNASLELLTGTSCPIAGRIKIKAEALSCPPGCVMSTIAKGKVACTCDTRLTKYTDTCSPQDGTILRNDTFWVGYRQYQL